MPQPPDRPGAEAPSARNGEDLRGLVEQYRPALRRYFYRKAHPAEVDDLVQEVFLNMHRRGAGQPLDSVEGYLFRIAANVLAKRHRDAPPPYADRIEEGFEPVEALSPERILIGKQAVARLGAALAALPPKTREAFILHRYQDMTYAAIAQRLHISVSAVEKLIIRALHLLRQAIEGRA